MSSLVSIDFDFLIYLPQDDRTIRLIGDKGEEIRGPAGLVFDFGAGTGSAFAEGLWPVRRHAFAQQGIDLERVITLRADQGTPTVPGFCEALAQRIGGLRDPEVPIAVHDDHNQALGLLTARLEHVEHIISFDAHHDLGYGPGDAERARAHRYTVGAWLYGALREQLADRVTVVYPDWRGLGEWQTMSDDIERCEQLAATTGTPEHWLADLRDRVTVTTWSRWLSDQSAPVYADGVFVSRSPGWSPPWCDPEFDELVDRLAAGRPVLGQRPARRRY
jgi:hypothetical protein